MTTELTTAAGAPVDRAIICPPDATGNKRAVLGEYQRWLKNAGLTWQTPSLAAFRDYLLTRDEKREYTTRTGKAATRRYGAVSPATVAGMLSVARSRLRGIIRSDQVQLFLLNLARFELEARGESATIADCKAMVDLGNARLQNALDPKAAAVEVEKIQDRTSGQVGVRLSREQANVLLATPGTVPIERLRDTAILAVLLCAGVREQELCNLEVKDLRVKNESGDLCLHVRRGKGCKTRLVPWGAGSWALAVVDKWLEASGITAGAIFRGFYKGNRRMRAGRITTRAIQKIVGKYPVMIDGKLTTIRPHDLRRTYAARCYAAGMDILGIQQNLGHADHKTTLLYIGAVNGKMRRPPALYSFDLSALSKVGVQGRVDNGAG